MTGPQPPIRWPSGVTAIIAAVLSLLGGTVQVGHGLSLLSEVGREPGTEPVVLLARMVVVSGLGLVLGGILLLRRRLIGRLIIVASCGLVILAAVMLVVSFSSVMTASDPERGYTGGMFLLGLLAVLPPLTIPIATMTLALLPATTRWCWARPPSRSSGTPPAPGTAQPPV